MIKPEMLQALKGKLFTGEEAVVFTVLDGASVPGVTVKLAAFKPEHACLLRGELRAELAEVAPYLAILERNTPFTDWVLTNGWGEHWGIFGTARAGLSALVRHFREILTAYDAAGNALYFRYYDPRVWREVIPACSTDELAALFGNVGSFLVEDEESRHARSFLLVNNMPREERVILG